MSRSNLATFLLALIILWPALTGFSIEYCLGGSGPWFERHYGFPLEYYRWSDFGGGSPPNATAERFDLVFSIVAPIAPAFLACWWIARKQWAQLRFGISALLAAAVVISVALGWNITQSVTNDDGVSWATYGAPFPVYWSFSSSQSQQSGWNVPAALFDFSIAIFVAIVIGAIVERLAARGRRKTPATVASDS